MIAAAISLPSGPRMRCEKYRAEISVATCLARQKRAAAAGSRWAYTGGEWDPGCVGCRQGMEVGGTAHGARLTAHGEKEVKTMGETAGARVATKRCSVCKEAKAASEFYTDLRLKDGLASRCKACQKRAATASRARAMARDKGSRRQAAPAETKEQTENRGGGGLQVRPDVAAPAAAGAVIAVTVDCSPLLAAIERLVERLTKEG